MAANAATNRHDFLVALDQALMRQAAGIKHGQRLSELAQEEEEPEEEVRMPELRIAGSQDG